MKGPTERTKKGKRSTKATRAAPAKTAKTAKTKQKPEALPPPTPDPPMLELAELPSEVATPYNIRILRHSMTPRIHDDRRLKNPSPYLPVQHACDICPARCCRMPVKVSLPDALELCRVLTLPFFAALTIVPSTLPRSFCVDADPRFTREGQEWPGRAEISLHRRDDGGCAMLKNIGGYERCSIYSVRPSTCRLYPISWNSDVAKGGPAMLMCPIPYGITEAMERQFMKDASRSIENWSIHDRVLEEWHGVGRSSRTVDDFLSFAIPRTAELLGVSADGVLVPGTADERLLNMMIDAKVIRVDRT